MKISKTNIKSSFAARNIWIYIIGNMYVDFNSNYPSKKQQYSAHSREMWAIQRCLKRSIFEDKRCEYYRK